MSSSVEFGITFGKKTFKLTLEKERTLGDLRKEIYLVTGVEPSQQKLMGLVPAGKNLREISDDTPLGNGLVKGQTWKRPRQKIIMFGASEKELSKQRDEEQEAIKKTQAIRDQFELMETEERRLDEEENNKFAAATERKMNRQYQSEVERNISRIKSFEESLTAGFLGIPFTGFGGEAFTDTSSTYDSPAPQNMPPVQPPVSNENADNSRLSSSESDLDAKISTSLYAYSSVMSEDNSGLLDISAKIILPRSILDEAVQKRIHFPLAFKIEGINSVGVLTSTVLGVMDFKAPEEVAFLPHWVLEKLNIEEGTKVDLETVIPPKGHSVILKPLCTESTLKKYGNVQALLEHHLQRYQFLTVGDFIQVPMDNENIIQFEVIEARMDKDTKVETISTIDVNLMTEINYEKDPVEDKDDDINMGDDDDDDDEDANEYTEKHIAQIDIGEESIYDIPKGKSKYLRLNIRNNEGREAVIIVVKPIIGDPDVYLSLSNENEYPDWTNYDICDQTEGTRILRVDTPPHNIYACIRSFNKENSKFSVIALYESNSELKEKHCGKKFTDATPVLLENYVSCSFCGKMIQQTNIRLHEMRCRRLNFRCGTCGAVMRIGNKEKHISLAHTKIKCQCGTELEQEALQVHRRSTCPYRIEVCGYCGLSLRAVSMEEHEAMCGSKSLTCAHCDKIILRRVFSKHLNEMHNIESINEKRDIK